jgi:hypothetical protein
VPFSAVLATLGTAVGDAAAVEAAGLLAPALLAPSSATRPSAAAWRSPAT